MNKQLNIRSDEAYELAHRLARREGKSVTRIVTEALAEKARVKAALPEQPLTDEEVAARFRRLHEARDRMWGGKPPPPIDPHDDDWMYDEHGLPR